MGGLLGNRPTRLTDNRFHGVTESNSPDAIWENFVSLTLTSVFFCQKSGKAFSSLCLLTLPRSVALWFPVIAECAESLSFFESRIVSSDGIEGGMINRRGVPAMDG